MTFYVTEFQFCLDNFSLSSSLIKNFKQKASLINDSIFAIFSGRNYREISGTHAFSNKFFKIQLEKNLCVIRICTRHGVLEISEYIETLSTVEPL